MTELKIPCSKCGHEIELTESLAAPLIQATRAQYEAAMAKKDADVARRQAAIEAERAKLEAMKDSLEDQVAQRLGAERERIAKEEAERARARAALDIETKTRQLTELQGVLRERDAKLAEAQKAQAEHLRMRRELEDKTRELELTIQKRVQESLSGEREKAKREAEEALRLRVAEKDELIAGMQRQIEELKRRAEQGSQQLQGEVLELELEARLRARFPHDVIEPVAKGVHGGDVLHKVAGPAGQVFGTILWETKRTKSWSDGWLAKLRGDQRAAKADVALLVTQALPKGVASFDLIDGVWVAEARCALPVALALRQSILEVAAARQAGEGQQTKMEMVYRYLTGPRFRHRIEAIVEKFSDMQEDLDRERRMMTKQWSKREAQIQGVLEATAGMYGDLQGIAGKAIEEIEGLAVPLLEDASLDTVDAE